LRRAPLCAALACHHPYGAAVPPTDQWTIQDLTRAPSRYTVTAAQAAAGLRPDIFLPQTVRVDSLGRLVVLEIGFGSGRNLAYYPAAVTRVLAVEPADLSWQRAQARVTASGMPVERVGLDGAGLPMPDARVDTVVSTWPVCPVVGATRRRPRPGQPSLSDRHDRRRKGREGPHRTADRTPLAPRGAGLRRRLPGPVRCVHPYR